jgi:predicted GTPase
MLIIAGLKADVLNDNTDKREFVTKEEGEKVASQIGAALHLQVSAKAGMNVNELFRQSMVATLTIDKKKKKR